MSKTDSVSLITSLISKVRRISFLFSSLQKRREQNALRKLLVNSELIDFCSNDYLGFSKLGLLSEKLKTSIQTIHTEAALKMSVIRQKFGYLKQIEQVIMYLFKMNGSLQIIGN